jgi:hypothetical protein
MEVKEYSGMIQQEEFGTITFSDYSGLTHSLMHSFHSSLSYPHQHGISHTEQKLKEVLAYTKVSNGYSDITLVLSLSDHSLLRLSK